MSTTEVKTLLHSYIEKADQTFLRIVHAMFEQYFEEEKIEKRSREEILLEQLQNNKLAVSEKQELDILNEKRQEENINEEEYLRLGELIEKVEEINVNRILYLTELAQIRKTTVQELMQTL